MYFTFMSQFEEFYIGFMSSQSLTVILFQNQPFQYNKRQNFLTKIHSNSKCKGKKKPNFTPEWLDVVPRCWDCIALVKVLTPIFLGK